MRILLVLLLVACGGSESETPASEAEALEPASDPAAESDATEGDEPEAEQPPPEAPLRTDLGWTEPPELPTAEARETNRRALRAHRRERFEDSLEGFQAALRLSAGYSNARFNAACALAKLERFDEAATELETLLALDLPTYGSRYLEDEDLAALRSSPEGSRLEALRATMRRSYEAVMLAGPPVVWERYENLEEDLDDDDAPEGRSHAQAGVWVSATRRFVPMGPAVSRDDEYLTSPIVQVRFDPWRRRVYNGTAVDYQGDMGIIGELDLRVYSAPDGKELGAARPRATEDDTFGSFRIAADERGVRWEFSGRHGYLVRETYEDVEVTIPPAGATFDPETARLTIGEGDDAKVVSLRRHRGDPDMSNDTQVVPLGEASLLVLTTSEIGTLDGMMSGDWILSKVDRESGEVSVLRRGMEEQAKLTVAPDGSVYLDAGGSIRTVVDGGVRVELPSGLRL